MRAIIVGTGEVGYNIAKFLTYEGVDVVVIDRDGEKLNRIVEELDITVVEGEGSDPAVFKEAGAENADLLIAVTNSDETNMIACLLGKAMFNVRRRIARIRNPDYFFNKEILGKNYLDIDPAINPELEVVKVAVKFLEIPFATEIIEFENGQIVVAGFKIDRESKLVGKELKTLRTTLKKDFVIGVIKRDEEVIIPRGEDIIKEGDIIYMPLKRDEVEDVAQALGIFSKPVRKVIIVGGGRIGYYIAKFIEHKVDVKIIEREEERCKNLSRFLKKSLILHADGEDKQLLIEENIKDMDAYITVDYTQWGSFPQLILLFLMFFGGMVGSTAGGIKQLRMYLIFKQIYRQFIQLIHPRAITSIKLNDKILTQDILESIWVFGFLALVVWMVASLIVAATGLDIVTSISTVASTLNNVGPALAKAGPAENYAFISPLGKWILTFCMLIGRLEYYTVLILLIPNFWRK